jgi:hypothetical protein
MNRKYDLNAPQGVAGPQFRQHVHQESSQMGAEHEAGQGARGNLRVDQDSNTKNRKAGKRVGIG